MSLKANLLSIRSGRKRLLISAFAAAALLSVTALALGTRGRSTPALGLTNTELSITAAAAAQNDRPAPPVGPVQVVRFALHDTGILPREAGVVQGRVVVSITDYTGAAAALVVEREDLGGAPEHAGRVRRAGGRWRGSQEMKLRPGTYTVYDESRPEARATLTVEP